ncbi:MAG: adenine phosphoribosyltransferase [Planctomycetaceae bacterium]|nr:adenine phosphoribosyltransferase [Planctomycetaceae bacterium]
MPMIELAKVIRDVPDFPKPGIIFKDITPLLASAEAMDQCIGDLVAPFRDKGIRAVVGIESRGFIFGAAAACRLGAGFVPIRKPGKLPSKTLSISYELEYGTDSIEIHADALAPGERVLMMDDLLATGGTMEAACNLVEKLGAQIVGVAFVVELCFLPGRQKLSGRNVHSLIKVAGE